jgi:hypothetical protein
MGITTDTFFDEQLPRARLGLLLQHFAELGDDREPWRIAYPLHEMLLLVQWAVGNTAASIVANLAGNITDAEAAIRPRLRKPETGAMIFSVTLLTPVSAENYLIHRRAPTMCFMIGKGSAAIRRRPSAFNQIQID